MPVRRYKLYALMLSAGFTALAGSLYAIMIGFVDPESGFGILVSVKMVIIAALAAPGTLFGPLVGALILVPLEDGDQYLVRRRRHRHSPTCSMAASSCLLAASSPAGWTNRGSAWRRGSVRRSRAA